MGLDQHDTLSEAVQRQAAARVAGDDATFASFLTAQALLQLGGGGLGAPVLPRARRYDVLAVRDHGDGTGDSSVRYSGGGSYVLRTHWQASGGVWRGVGVDAPAEEMRAPWWRRLTGRGPRVAPPVERRDLS